MRQYVPTVSQQLIWLDQLIAGPSPKYNIGGYACLQGTLAYDRFFEAIKQVLSSQEVYSSQFDVMDEALICNLGNAADACTVELLDFSGREQAEQQALQWMEKEFAQVFELKNNYLFSFKLLKIHDTKHFWFAKIHHLISDGWSFSLLLNQTAGAYSRMPGEQTPMPVYAYSSYAEDDEAYYRSETMRQDREFWLTEYKQLPAPIFPKIPEEWQQKSAGSKSGSQTLYISRELKSALQKLAEEKKASLFHVFLGVLLVYFGRTMQQPVMAVGVPVLNRGKKVYRQTAGMFMNLLALKFEINPEGYFDGLLQMVKQKMSAALRHQRYQYGNLVKDLKLNAGNLLYDFRVSYEDFDFNADFGGLQANAVAFSNLSEHDKMAIYVRDYHDEGFDVRFVYRADYFRDEQVSAICENLEQVMQSLVGFQTSPISQWQLLTDAQRRQLIRLGNGPERINPFESFAGLWQRSCSMYGQQVAVSGVNGSFTYEQLHVQVEKVAAALRIAAAEKGRQVVLLLPRSEKMIAGMLASILADVCYIPLDPHFPAERIQEPVCC